MNAEEKIKILGEAWDEFGAKRPVAFGTVASMILRPVKPSEEDIEWARTKIKEMGLK